MQYKTYCWKIRPLSPYLTPWQSDTIYGHLFWAISMLDGEEELKNILKQFTEKNPPFICSDGFMENSFPLLQKEYIGRDFTTECHQRFQLSFLDTVKMLKKINKLSNISLEHFNLLRGKMRNTEFIQKYLWEEVKKEEKEMKRKENSDTMMTQTYHNVINRMTGSTGDNAIFSTSEYVSSKDILVFIKIRADYSSEKIDQYLHWMEENGYGKKVSSGKGHIERISFEEFNKFPKIEEANGFVVLSNYIPDVGDYEKEQHVEVLTKMPKLASDYTLDRIPFKKTFSCFTRGSIFHSKAPKEVVGKVLQNIHKDPDIVQIGIPFVLEVNLPCQK